ncbi:hypothetical protein DVH24_030087 [Malus domestica]|uniref:CBS domain-containing protein n=1 Tax=Malus domestica TaxID=3750 RepID=A0A498HV84_MALDO|nr:hypothetical protein DVH24_030087 [Malus domestica]
MASIFVPEPPLLPLSASSASAPANRLQCLPLLSRPGRRLFPIYVAASGLRRSFNVAAGATFMPNSVPEKTGVFTVGDFMTRREDLHVVKPTTTVDEAIELLVENRITGFPVIDDDWKLIGLVSDYDLLALDTISGSKHGDEDVEGDEWYKDTEYIIENKNSCHTSQQTKYRRLPVVNESGKLIGIITRGNIIRAALQMKHASELKT